jgi:transglutaminase-like putative cysteine protease
MLRTDLKKQLPRAVSYYLRNETKINKIKFPFDDHKKLIKRIMLEMKKIINESVERDPIMRTAAILILSHSPKSTEQNDVLELKTIHRFVRNNFRYTRDIFKRETLHEPQVILLKNASIDCDDFSILLSSLFISVGYKVRLKAVRTKGKPMIHHVYIEVWSGQKGKWFAVDGIMKKRGLFYEPEIDEKILLEV